MLIIGMHDGHGAVDVDQATFTLYCVLPISFLSAELLSVFALACCALSAVCSDDIIRAGDKFFVIFEALGGVAPPYDIDLFRRGEQARKIVLIDVDYLGVYGIHSSIIYTPICACFLLVLVLDYNIFSQTAVYCNLPLYSCLHLVYKGNAYSVYERA